MTALKAYLWLLAALTLSGLLLMLFYVPVAVALVAPAPGAGPVMGPALRGFHFWAAQTAVIAVLALLGRTIFVKTNRSRVGLVVALVSLTCLLWFTGMLLPWDQITFWIQSRLHGINAQNAPWSVYWTHTLALSLLTLIFLIAYVRRMRRNPAATA